VDYVVTDAGAPAALVGKLRAKGIQVVLAGAATPPA
jgi:hypothetical protein